MGERLVEVGPVELCIETFGDPAGPTVLLVSGASASMDWWYTGLCRRLAEAGRHVVRYDHRDTGRSTTATPGRPSYDGWQLGRDCAGLVEALGRAVVAHADIKPIRIGILMIRVVEQHEIDVGAPARSGSTLPREPVDERQPLDMAHRQPLGNTRRGTVP